MKTPLFFIVAIAAFVALPVDFTLSASALFGAGLAAILFSDYRVAGRRFSQLPRRNPTVAGMVARSPEALRLAA